MVEAISNSGPLIHRNRARRPPALAGGGIAFPP